MNNKRQLPFLSPSSRVSPTPESKPGPVSPVGVVDYAIIAFGRLLLIGWLNSPENPSLTAFSLSEGGRLQARAQFVRYPREDVDIALRAAGRSTAGNTGFISIVDIERRKSPLEDLLKTGETISVQLETARAEYVQAKLKPIPLRDAMSAGVLSEAQLALIDRFEDPIRDEVNKLSVLLKGLVRQRPLRCFIDGAHTADDRRVLVGGWAEGVESGTLLLCDAALAETPRRLEIVVTRRSDVADHLGQQGARVLTDRLGFMAVAELVPGNRVVRLCKVEGGSADWSQELTVDAKPAPLRALVGAALATAQASGANVVVNFDRLTRKLVGSDAPPAPRVSYVSTFGPPEGARPPRVSIIVPFYGDGSYLLDHVHAQARAPSDVEWIFVCDDPRLLETLTSTLSSRQGMLRQPTKLVVLGANGGFAHANNIGVANSSGEYLLLMNSDIYCRDFSFLDGALKLFEANQKVGCVGFSLQFEDGTVQHDGIRFRRAPWFESLWACEHDGKGMPQRWTAQSNIEVQAVTAALMLIRKADFQNGNVLDPGYLIGDFEDADLCLRLRNQGKSIRLLRTGGLFHLERQSLRHIGDSQMRRAVTLLNCIKFNERWSPMIESLAGER